jgi:hypothetical protein
VRRAKQLTEQELFEAQQLIRSGVLPVNILPMTQKVEWGCSPSRKQKKKQIIARIEVNRASLSSNCAEVGVIIIHYCQEPRWISSTFGYAAGTSQAKERRVTPGRQNQLIDSIPKSESSMGRSLPEAGERHFAQG